MTAESMDGSGPGNNFSGVRCATWNEVLLSSADRNPLSTNDQGVTTLHNQHVFVVFMNVDGRGSSFAACPKCHLASVHAIESVTSNARCRLIRGCDLVDGVLHEFREVVHSCDPLLHFGGQDRKSSIGTSFHPVRRRFARSC